MVDGRLRTYKRGRTMGEYTPWLKNMLGANDRVVDGLFLADWLN